jgi:hypothetical protein
LPLINSIYQIRVANTTQGAEIAVIITGVSSLWSGGGNRIVKSPPAMIKLVDYLGFIQRQETIARFGIE